VATDWEKNLDNKTKKIVAIGSKKGFSIGGTTEVDVVAMKHGQTLRVGQTWRKSKVKLLVEIKTSISGRVGANQRGRLMALAPEGKYRATIGTPYRWTQKKKWHKNPKYTRVMKLLVLIGMANTALNVLTAAESDAELVDIRQDAMSISRRDRLDNWPNDLQRITAKIAVQKKIAIYLRRFVTEDTVVDVTDKLMEFVILHSASD